MEIKKTNFLKSFLYYSIFAVLFLVFLQLSTCYNKTGQSYWVYEINKWNTISFKKGSSWFCDKNKIFFFFFYGTFGSVGWQAYNSFSAM